jgi:hypothetical protein
MMFCFVPDLDGAKNMTLRELFKIFYHNPLKTQGAAAIPAPHTQQVDHQEMSLR